MENKEAPKKAAPKKEPAKKVDVKKEVLNTVYGLIDMTEHRMLNKVQSMLGGMSDAIDAMRDEIDSFKHELKEMDRREKVSQIDQALNRSKADFLAFQNKMFGVDLLKDKCANLEADVGSINNALHEIPRLGKKLSAVDDRVAALEADSNAISQQVRENKSLCEEKNRTVRQKLANSEDLQKARHDEILKLIDVVELQAKKEHGKADDVRKELYSKIDDARSESKRYEVNHQHLLNELSKDHSRLLHAHSERMEIIKETVESLTVSVKDFASRTNFVEMMGNRLNRMERKNEQHDLMFKEISIKLKGVKPNG